MLLRLSTNPGPRDLAPLHALAERLGYDVQLLGSGGRVAELTLTGGRERGAPGDRSAFEDLTVVESVLEAPEAPELTARVPGRETTRVDAADGSFGGDRIALVAGPCAVEDRARLVEIARSIRASGAALLRGGAYKPRTSPWSFQGLGEAGLEWLEEARAETGLGIVTEVLDVRDVERVARTADVLQIGSRNMSNAPLLREVGQSGRPVLLKRGMTATAREFLLAAEYVLSEGNERVLLCERGIRSFDSATRNVLDLGTVAWLKERTHLPVVVDPSHAAGRASLIPALARAGLAVGADGLLVEVHPAPEEVHSDGAQALSLEGFAEIAESALALARMQGKILARPEPEAAPRGRETVLEETP